MADQSLRFPEGMVKDVMVRIQKHYIPADFLVLDMQGDDEILILLGRPFLYIAKSNIYIGSGHILFNVPAGKVRCQFRTLCNHEQTRKKHNRRRRQARRQATQHRCGWEDFPGKIVKYEDHLMEEEENTQAPQWSEWAVEAERMDQIAKKEKEEILARLEAWEKENRTEEVELEEEETKETEARWEEDARIASPQYGELAEVTSDNEPTE